MDQSQVRICVSVCESTVAAQAMTGARIAQTADLVELRLDCLTPAELRNARDELQASLSQIPVPVILTLRSAEQGGRHAVDYESRLDYWSKPQYPSVEFIDVELEMAEALQRSIQSEPGGGLRADLQPMNEPREASKPAQIARATASDWARIICSYHDLSSVPDDLIGIYERMSRTPARVLKIAVTARDVTDCLPIFGLLDRARSEGREIVVIAMGTPGIATRILGPSRGSFLTYAAREKETATAPGQLTIAEMETCYRIRKIDRQTQIHGLMGRPISHSVSPQMHNAAFAAENVNAVYLPFEVHDAGAFIRRMVHPETRELDWKLRGLSITAPHKSTVIHYLDRIDAAARGIGAVNTIVVETAELHGYNTDGPAFLAPLVEKLGSLREARVAVIGLGGAALAALWALRRERAELAVFTRNVEKARSVAARFGARCEQLSGARLGEFDVVVNATPLGTAPHLVDQTPAGARQLCGARLAYDLVYNPAETRFLREARTAGCDTVGGLAMLIHQAERQFRLWTGTAAPVDVMRHAALQALSNV